MLLQDLVVFILSAAGMIVSAVMLVKSLHKIARFLRISEFNAAFIIMAIATSSPELFVGIVSALSGVQAISLGNLIGASIADLTLITGIFILIGKGIKIKKGKVSHEVYYTISAIILVIILFAVGKSLSRTDGIILLSLFTFNFLRVLIKGRKYPVKLKKDSIERIELIIIFFALAFLILFFSSKFAVKSGSSLALDLKIPQFFIGLFMLSFATTLPEFIFSIEACKMRHKSMALGDITGGIFTNFTLVLGLVAVINPISISLLSFIIPASFLLAYSLIFLRFLKTGNKLKINEGIGLIMLYVLFVVIEFFVSSI